MRSLLSCFNAFCLIAALPAALLFAQTGRKETVPVAARPSLRNAQFLEDYALTDRFTNGRPGAIHITRAGDAVLFLRSKPRTVEQDLYEFNVAKGTERVLATAAQLLGGAREKLSDVEKARRERMRLSAGGLTAFDVSRDGRTILIPFSGKLYLFDRATTAVRELKSVAGPPVDPRFSPDGKWVACVRDSDLYVTEIASGRERRLTRGATPTLSHGLAEFVAQEEMDRMRGYWWSPDSRRLVYQETNTSDVEELSISDQAHPERPVQELRYPRPGKKNARVRLGVVSVMGGQTEWLVWDHAAFPYLANATWEQNSPLTVLVQNREQTLERLYVFDSGTWTAREILQEADDKWLNLEPDMPSWRNDGKSFLWSTERRGAWQLELHDRDGRLARVLTAPELNYRRLVGIDEKTGAAFFAAGEDPTQTHLYRVLLDKDAQPEQLSKAPGVHNAILSEESGVSVRSGQSLTSDPKWVIHRHDGRVVGELVSHSETPSLRPNVELQLVGEKPELHAAVIRPSDFDPKKRYPVVVSVYGGPHFQMVTAAQSRYLLDAWLAEQGFIVVSVDGRGTPARGRQWERAIKGNFIALPLADQVRGLQSLAVKYPQLDLERVGIFGWSFGGYFTAMAVLQRPDIFRAGVAGAPVTDWLDYDTHYTERYLGLPGKNAAAYRNSSVLENASRLRRPLLLIHGTADDNVFFLHSIRLADALFRAGREFAFLPLSGQTHMVSDPTEVRALYTRIADYFLEHLGTTRKKSAKIAQ